jgi:hypothetical protein
MTTLANQLPVYADPPPLHVDEEGPVRVGDTRVSLDQVFEQYENGMTPEDITRAYDRLVLADVHAVCCPKGRLTPDSGLPTSPKPPTAGLLDC